VAGSGDSLGELKVDVSVEVDEAKVASANQTAATSAQNVWTQAAGLIEQRNAQAVEASASKLGGTLTTSADTAAETQEDAAKKAENAWQSAAAKIGAALASAFAVDRIKSFVEGVFDSGLAIDRQARALGISTAEFQRLGFVAEQAGLEASDMAAALGTLSQKADEAGTRGSNAAKRFKQLGIDVKDANGDIRPTSDLLRDAANALQRTAPGAARTALAMELFGQKGRLLLPVLEDGAAGVEELAAQFDELGGGLDQETIDEIKKTDDAIGRLRLAFMREVLPAVRTLIEWFGKLADKARPWIARAKEIITDSHNIRTALGVVTAALVLLRGSAIAARIQMLSMWIATLGPALLVVAAIALVVLGWEDLWTTLEGGDSVIRRTLNNLLGVEKAQGVIDAINERVENMRAFLDATAAAAELLGAVFVRIGADIWNAMEPLHGLFESIKNAVVGLFDSIDKVLPHILNALGPIGSALNLATGTDAGSSREFAETARAAAAQVRGGVSAGSPGALTASPGQVAAARGAGAQVVNANARAQVEINGIVDTNSNALRDLVRRHIEESMRAVNEQAVEGVVASRGGR
jgi:hypothetical protein